MNAEGIKARIAIGRCKNGDVTYIYDYNKLMVLNIPKDTAMTGNTYLVKNTVFELDGEKFKINDIRTNFFERTFIASDEKENPFQYNFEISYFVEDVV